MKKIASFEKNHFILNPGIYIGKDKDILTIDLRMRTPYLEDTVDINVLHALEHVFATVTRNLLPDKTVYVGPMGCRTGFYFLLKVTEEEVQSVVKEILTKSLEVEGVPGGIPYECGNALDFTDEVIEESKNEIKLTLNKIFNTDYDVIEKSVDEYLNEIESYSKERINAIFHTVFTRKTGEIYGNIMEIEEMKKYILDNFAENWYK